MFRKKGSSDVLHNSVDISRDKIKAAIHYLSTHTNTQGNNDIINEMSGV